MLHAVYLQRLGGLSRDDEMALGVAGCEVDSAMCSILALACAQDVDEARAALYETASEFLHGWHPSQIGRAERSAA